MIKIKFISSVIVASFFSSSAMAASFSSPVTAKSDFVFANPTPVLKISLGSGIKNTAGNVANNDNLANFIIDSNIASYIGFRPTPGAGVDSDTFKVTLKGKNNPANILKLTPFFTGYTLRTVGTDKYQVSNRGNYKRVTFSYHADGNQIIAADSYPLSVDAVTYNP